MTVLKNTGKNTGKNSTKGRPFKDPVFKYRALLWYWAIRQKSGLRDGELDIEFSDPEPDGRKRIYEDRVRIFEDIRKSGATISGGKHKRRKFDLIERVDSHYNLAGSADIYHSIFWDILADTNPTLEKNKTNFLELLKICELSAIKFDGYSAPSEDELKMLSERLSISLDTINEILEPDIFTNESKLYDDILQSFSNITHFYIIAEGVDFKKISDYLNILAFYISFYRYAILTGNFHALVAAADSINEHLSLLLLDIKWLQKDFTRELFHLIYRRVFHFGNTIDLDKFGSSHFSEVDKTQMNDSALYKLFDLLDN